MKKAIVGKKIGMTQIFTEDGRLVPVTVIKAGPCTVVQTKTVESDGYNAVQVGFGELRSALRSCSASRFRATTRRLASKPSACCANSASMTALVTRSMMC